MKQLNMNKIKRLLPMLLLVLCLAPVYGQERYVVGYTKDVLGYPIQGVVVTIQNTTYSAITDKNGAFEIGANNTMSMAHFELQGFEPLTVDINATEDTVNVVLVADNLGSETIPIAYGRVSDKDNLSALSVVRSKDLTKSLRPNLHDALVGRLNGLTVFPSDYEPGSSGYSSYVRGLKTTSGNNAPLLLVDNVERDFSQLSANEVETVTVLKDATALALYGSRGANGVILVTTKRGEENKRTVSVNATYSYQKTEGVREYLNSYDYAQLYNKAWEMDGNTTPFYSSETIDGYKKTVEGSSDADSFRYPNNNYMNEFLNEVSPQTKVDVSMTGGNKSARYFAMVGYLKQDGFFKYGEENDEYSSNTNYQRFNFRTNVDINVTKVVSAFFDMAARIELRHYPGSSAGEIFNVLTTTPSNAYPIFNRNGSLGGTTTYQNNPYGLIAQSGYTETNRRIFDANAGFKFDFGQWVKGLFFTTRTGFDFNNLKARGLSKSFAVFEEFHDTGEYIQYGNYSDDSDFGYAVTNNGFYRQITNHEQLDYIRSFAEKHNLNAMAFFDVSTRSIPGNNPKYKNVSFGGRIQYNYSQKYYLELVGSSTANEAFVKGKRFGFFPAASVGWSISEEQFLKESSAVNYLKIRASTGKTGLDRPYGTGGDYRFLYLDNWSTGASGYGFGNPQKYYGGSNQSAVGNKDLQWEEATKTNVGVDAEFVNHIYLTADMYYEKRSGIWVKRDGWVPSTYGASTPFENAGSTESSGVELSLGVKGGKGDFAYDVVGMVNTMKSKILDMQDAPQQYDYQYSAGKEIGELWGLNSLGLFKDNIDIENSPEQLFGTVRPGDIKYVDYNNDNIIDGDDVHATGKTWFPSITYSINADLKYKNFDLSMLWQGMQDRHIVTPLYVLPFINNNASSRAYDAWTPETAETAKYPRLTTSEYDNNARLNDLWVIDASYIRLKSIELGYRLPQSLLNKGGIADVRFFVNGFNLLTISSDDFDPDVPSAGIYQYPAAKVYSFGINLSF